MTKINDLHKDWMDDPEYVVQYNALAAEFGLAEAVAKPSDMKNRN